ncbi:hypothetical protein SteCoe_7308 [Stentor coeruleus]|uniref:Fe2OG dioxygenase domain-containing protein n=1 Tax=Stentor coeruleus TaxID=5963 RepID=A0A1R2CN02_9CILI|nr:hypothetical protein SteCoe_7308 [Stentor coeruleus]
MAIMASSIRSVTRRLFSSTEPLNKLLTQINIDKLKWYSESDIPSEIPLIDLQSMSQHEKNSSFKQAFETARCVYIKNHLFSNKESEDLVNITRKLFTQSEEVKSKMVHPYKGIMRGYKGFGREKSAQIFDHEKTNEIDAHISFSWGPADNVYPDLTFQKLWKRYYKKTLKLSKEIAELAIENAGIQDVIDWNNLKVGDHLLKLQEYVALGDKSHQTQRLGPHVDFDFFTMINQLPAENGYIGLQVNMNGKILNLPAVKGTIVILFGEAMQSISNGKVKGPIHNVVSPQDNMYEGSSRTSIIFCLQPDPKTKVSRTEGSCYSEYYGEKGTLRYGDFHSRLISEFYKN